MRYQLLKATLTQLEQQFVAGVVLKFFRGKKGNVISVFRGKVVIPRFAARDGDMYPVILANAGRAWVAELDPRYVKVLPVITLVQRGDNGEALVLYKFAKVFSASDVVLGVSIDDRTYVLKVRNGEDVKRVVEEKTGFRPAVTIEALLGT